MILCLLTRSCRRRRPSCLHLALAGEPRLGEVRHVVVDSQKSTQLWRLVVSFSALRLTSHSLIRWIRTMHANQGRQYALRDCTVTANRSYYCGTPSNALRCAAATPPSTDEPLDNRSFIPSSPDGGKLETNTLSVPSGNTRIGSCREGQGRSRRTLWYFVHKLGYLAPTRNRNNALGEIEPYRGRDENASEFSCRCQ